MDASIAARLIDTNNNTLNFLAHEQSSAFTQSVFNSFLGALLALLSLVLTNIIGRIVRRQIQHYNSLVTLESQLNEMIGIVMDNLYLFPPFKSAIKGGNIYWSQIRTIPVDKTHLTNLADIELINEVFEFFYMIRKLNDDVEGLLKGYNEIKNAYIEKHISVVHYVKNAEIIAEQLDLMEIFQEDLLEKLLELMVKIRIQIRRDKPWIVRIQEIFKFNSSEKISLKEFKKEKEKLKKELDESSERSREEIAKMLKRKKS